MTPDERDGSPRPSGWTSDGARVADRIHPVHFFCAQCGELAATIELFPPTTASSSSDDTGENQWSLTVDGPVQVTHWILRGLDALQLALREKSIIELREINPEYANFWCPACTAVYCKEHWAPIEPEMDEGFYDATYGTCPRGHRAMLDD